MSVWLVRFETAGVRDPREVEADDPISAVLAAVNKHGAVAGDLEMTEGERYTTDFIVRRMPNDGVWFSVRWRWS